MGQRQVLLLWYVIRGFKFGSGILCRVKRLVAGLSLPSLGFDSRLVHVIFVVDGFRASTEVSHAVVFYQCSILIDLFTTDDT